MSCPGFQHPVHAYEVPNHSRRGPIHLAEEIPCRAGPLESGVGEDMLDDPSPLELKVPRSRQCAGEMQPGAWLRCFRLRAELPSKLATESPRNPAQSRTRLGIGRARVRCSGARAITTGTR